MRQLAGKIDDRERNQPHPLFVEGAADHPRPLFGGAWLVVFLGCRFAQTVTPFGFGSGERTVDARQQRAEVHPVPVATEAERGSGLALAIRRGNGHQIAQQSFRDRPSVRLAGQHDREIGTVQAGTDALRISGGALTDKVAATPQKVVGRGAAETTVDARQIAETNHQQLAVGDILGIERLAQPRHEVVTIGEPGERIEIRFATDGLESGGFFLEHRLESPHRHVHGRGQLAQLRHFGFVDGDKTALGDGNGLINDGIERPLQPAQDQGTEVTPYQPGSGQRGNHLQHAFPQRTIGEPVMADQMDGTELLPAIADLRQPGIGPDGQPADEPAGGVEVGAGGAAFDDDVTQRVADTDRLVVTAVEQGTDRQFDTDRIRIAVTERKRECRSIVGVLDRELRFQIVARAQHRCEQAAGQRKQRADDDGHPELAVHGHGQILMQGGRGRSFEPLRVNTTQGVFPARQPAGSTGRRLLLAGNTGEDPLAVETEHRLQITTLRSRADRRIEIVEHQRLRIRRRIVCQNHVRNLHRARRTVASRLDVDQTQPGSGNAGLAQRNVFDDGEVLAIPSTLPNRLQRGRPVVALLPDGDIVIENDMPIDEVIDQLQARIVFLRLGRLDRCQPVVE